MCKPLFFYKYLIYNNLNVFFAKFFVNFCQPLHHWLDLLIWIDSPFHQVFPPVRVKSYSRCGAFSSFVP